MSDDHVGRLGMRGGAELVLPVDGRIEPIRARLEREAVRVAQPAGDDSQTGAVGLDGEDRGAPRVFLDADVARRAAAQVEAPVAAEDDVVLLMLAERQAAERRRGGCEAPTRAGRSG